MIGCDKCGFWSHTVCMGYLSNDDARIPRGSFVCYACKWNLRGRALQYVTDLCRLRRAISIVMVEGMAGTAQFSNRIGLHDFSTRKVIARLVSENILKKSLAASGPHNGFKKCQYDVLRTEETKRKIMHFFTADLDKFPEFQMLQNYKHETKSSQTSFAQAKRCIEQSLNVDQGSAENVKKFKASVPIQNIKIKGN